MIFVRHGRAIETAEVLGPPTIDPRLHEITRPWTDDLGDSVVRSFAGDPHRFWSQLPNPDAWGLRGQDLTRLGRG